MKLVLFDFDGTLTNRDSFIGFIHFASRRTKVWKAAVVFFFKILAYKTGLYSGGKLKNEILSYFFKGLPKNTLNKLGSDYNEKKIPSIIRKDVMKQLLEFQKEGHEICIVSASLDIWLKPFCRDLNINCICTELEFKEGLFTGNFATLNCNFDEKVIRVKQRYNLLDYEEIVVYGNSKGDRDLFEIADTHIKI